MTGKDVSFFLDADEPVLSVTEVCFAVGCSSLGTFSTRFAELVGMPPEGRASRVAGTAPPHRPTPVMGLLSATRFDRAYGLNDVHHDRAAAAVGAPGTDGLLARRVTTTV